MKIFRSPNGFLHLHQLQSRVRFRATPGAFLSTEALPPDSLYHRVVLMPDRTISVVPVLEKWVEEGKHLEKTYLQKMVKQLKGFKRFTHALEISMWMSDRRYFRLSPGDLADRLDLIYRVHGLEHAENYFNTIPKQLRVFQTYGALLSCYAEEKSVEKANALFQKMEELGLLNSFSYNVLMKLYAHTGHGKVESVFQEMKERGIPPDDFTHDILMDACATTSNIRGMEIVLKRIIATADWHKYAIAAKAYVKAGLIDKSLVALKRLEELAPRKKGRVAYGFLLTVFADIGKKDEIYRIWNAYKSLENASNSMYMCIISGLLKLDDVEGAEEIFKEWESQFINYDFRVPNLLIGAYCKKGQLSKAEALVSDAVQRGTTPYASTWAYLAGGYIKDDQILKGVEMTKKSLAAGKTWWKPSHENVSASLDYFREQKDVDAAEEFVGMVRQLVPLTKEAYHGLLRTYMAAGQPVSGVLDRMKDDGFDVDEDANKIIESCR